MEQPRTPTPLSFSRNAPESWRRFRQEFDLFMKANGATKKDGEQKVAIFLNIAGSEALDVFNCLQLSEL